MQYLSAITETTGRSLFPRQLFNIMVPVFLILKWRLPRSSPKVLLLAQFFWVSECWGNDHYKGQKLMGRHWGSQACCGPRPLVPSVKSPGWGCVAAGPFFCRQQHYLHLLSFQHEKESWLNISQSCGLHLKTFPGQSQERSLRWHSLTFCPWAERLPTAPPTKFEHHCTNALSSSEHFFVAQQSKEHQLHVLL